MSEVLNSSNKASINRVLTPWGKTVMHAAAQLSDLPQVKKLLTLGADPNVKDSDGRTPLHYAAEKNDNESHFKVIEVLLKKGADPNVKDTNGQSPFYILLKTGNLKIVQFFLNFKADINVLDIDNCNLLFSAASNSEDLEVLQLLIRLGLDVNHKNKFGSTSFHSAINFDDVCMQKVKILLKSGAQLTASPVFGAIGARLENYIINDELEGDIEKEEFNFLMEHIINFNSEDDQLISTFESTYLPVPDNWWKWILEHFAKLQSLDIPLHPTILEIIADTEKGYDDYYEECKQELLLAKNTKLPDTWLTFSNLLFDNRRKLKNYAGNSELIKDFEKNYWQEKFPIYAESISQNVKKGIKRRKLFEKSAIVLSNCLPIFNSSHLIIRDTLDCILSKKDLSKFCN